MERLSGKVRHWGLLFLCVACTGTLAAQDIPPDQPKCFDLSRVNFPTWADHPADSLYYQVPPRVRLMPLREGESGVLDVPEGALPPPHGWNQWWVEGDTLRMVWSTGFFGVEVRLPNSAGAVIGTANPFTDVAGTPIPTDDVEAVPVNCDARLVYRESEMRRFLRYVPLRDGIGLRLGEVIPSGLQVDSLRRSEIVVAEGADWAEEATRIGVNRTRSGRVKRVRLTYPTGVPVAVLRGRLTEVVGAWTSEGGSGWMWHGRGERLHLIESGQGLILTIEDPRIDFRR